jgi:hypothetical protein
MVGLGVAQAPAPPTPPADVPDGGTVAAPPPAELTPAQRVEALIAEGDALYARRYEKVTWWQALNKYNAALGMDPKNYGAMWRVARSYFFIAERQTDDDTKEQYGKTGWDWGLKAIKLNPKGVEGHYFAGIALGQYAQAISILSALAKGLDGDYRELIGAALKIDRYHDGAGPVIAMGRYYFTLPWPKYDGEESIKFLREAIAHGDKLRSHFYLAETLLSEDQAAEALKEVQIVLDRKLVPGKGDYADDLWFQQQAPALKKKIQEELQ